MWLTGDQSALTSNTVTKSGIVGISDELSPVPVGNARTGPGERILDAIKERGVGLKFARGTGYNSRPSPEKFESTNCSTTHFAVRLVQLIAVESVRTWLGVAGRFIGEGFRVRIQLSGIYGLEWLLIVFS